MASAGTVVPTHNRNAISFTVGTIRIHSGIPAASSARPTANWAGKLPVLSQGLEPTIAWIDLASMTSISLPILVLDAIPFFES